MSLSLLLRQRSSCLVRLTSIVFELRGKWPYSCCFKGCCVQDLFLNIQNKTIKLPEAIVTKEIFKKLWVIYIYIYIYIYARMCKCMRVREREREKEREREREREIRLCKRSQRYLVIVSFSLEFSTLSENCISETMTVTQLPIILSLLSYLK